MEMRGAYGLPDSPVPLFCRAGILLATIGGLMTVVLFSNPWDEGWFRYAPAFAMAVIAGVTLFQVRFLVLPQIVAKARGDGTPLEATAQSMYLIAGSFAFAPAMYGAVNAFITDAWWIPLAFGAYAMVLQALFFAEVRSQLARLKFDMQTGGSR